VKIFLSANELFAIRGERMKQLRVLTIALSLALGTFGCGDDEPAIDPPGADGGMNGADGKDGADGQPGERGAMGEQGEPGSAGPAGQDGKNGAPGAPGATGAQGQQGPRGFTGTEGRHDLSAYVVEGGQGRTITTRGGKGTNGNGGDGDYIEMYNYNGNSNIEVRTAGSPNTMFTAPTYPPSLGDNPKTISSDTTFTLGGSLTATTLVAGNTSMLGDDGMNPATGLHVAANTTLTIAVNWDRNNTDSDNNTATGTLEQAHLIFAQGVLLEGRIAVVHRDLTTQGDAMSPHTGDVWIEAGQFVSRTGSSINTSGADAASGSNGGNAGELNLQMHGSGTIILGGAVDTTGGDGDNGGTGGYVSLTGGGSIYMLGTIDTSGGVGNAANGGSAGDLNSDVSQGHYISAATVRTRGGNGATSGGDGGSVDFYSDNNGAVVVTPAVTVDTSGGNATSDGSGGDAGYIDVYAYSGTIRVAGTLRAHGGNGAGTGSGGDGDSIYFETNYNDYPNRNHAGGYGMYIGANMDASGGDGANGGDSGYVSLYDYGSYNTGVAQLGVDPVMLLGYASFDASGGDGTVGGGRGGDTCYIETYNSASDGNGDTWSAGSIVNEVPWRSNGGKGGSGTGGDAGDIYFDTDSSYSYPETPNLTNTGALSAAGGDGTDGGSGAEIYLYAYGTLNNTGALNSAGGKGTNQGGGGGYIELSGDYEFINKANVTSRGGDGGTGNAGDSNEIWMASRFLSHTGAIDASGGASVDGAGGDGSDIEIRSSERPSTLSGSVASAGGDSTNGADGQQGDVVIDGLQVGLSAAGSITL
jgi:hypothetical protein